MNAILAILFGLLACFQAAAWFEPSVAEYVARQLRARAAGVRARRAAYREAFDAALKESSI